MHDIEDKKITIFQKKIKFEIKFFTDTMDIRVIKKSNPNILNTPPQKKKQPKNEKTENEKTPESSVTFSNSATLHIVLL